MWTVELHGGWSKLPFDININIVRYEFLAYLNACNEQKFGNSCATWYLCRIACSIGLQTTLQIFLKFSNYFFVYLEILHTIPAEVDDNRMMWLTFSTKKTPTVHKKWLKYDDSDYSKYIFCQKHSVQ